MGCVNATRSCNTCVFTRCRKPTLCQKQPGREGKLFFSIWNRSCFSIVRWVRQDLIILEARASTVHWQLHRKHCVTYLDLTSKRGSVGQNKGLLIPGSSESVRFRLNPENSNSHGFKRYRHLIEGAKLLLKVTKAIIFIIDGVDLGLPGCVITSAVWYAEELILLIIWLEEWTGNRGSFEPVANSERGRLPT